MSFAVIEGGVLFFVLRFGHAIKIHFFLLKYLSLAYAREVFEMGGLLGQRHLYY